MPREKTTKQRRRRRPKAALARPVAAAPAPLEVAFGAGVELIGHLTLAARALAGLRDALDDLTVDRRARR